GVSHSAASQRYLDLPHEELRRTELTAHQELVELRLDGAHVVADVDPRVDPRAIVAPDDVFFFSSGGGHTRCYRDWSSDVCSSDLIPRLADVALRDVATCRLDERVGDVQDRMRADQWELAVVLDTERVVLGVVNAEAPSVGPATLDRKSVV